MQYYHGLIKANIQHKLMAARKMLGELTLQKNANELEILNCVDKDQMGNLVVQQRKLHRELEEQASTYQDLEVLSNNDVVLLGTNISEILGETHEVKDA
jgi:hypothetical protein